MTKLVVTDLVVDVAKPALEQPLPRTHFSAADAATSGKLRLHSCWLILTCLIAGRPCAMSFPALSLVASLWHTSSQ
jgi:hypothetical protein